jgi:hypothetical protein
MAGSLTDAGETQVGWIKDLWNTISDTPKLGSIENATTDQPLGEIMAELSKPLDITQEEINAYLDPKKYMPALTAKA